MVPPVPGLLSDHPGQIPPCPGGSRSLRSMGQTGLPGGFGKGPKIQQVAVFCDAPARAAAPGPR
jgi:hypothetical protein